VRVNVRKRLSHGVYPRVVNIVDNEAISAPASRFRLKVGTVLKVVSGSRKDTGGERRVSNLPAKQA